MKAIGVDAGASSTIAMLVDESGKEIARTNAGGANLRTVGAATARQSLSAAIAPLIEKGDVRSVCVGAAGAGRDADRAVLTDMVRAMLASDVKLLITHDGRITLRASSVQRPAMIVIAGTGSLVYGERADGTAVRAGGYGALIGDDGGGYAIGLAAIRHAARALDGIDHRGALADFVAKTLGARSPADIIERVHRWPPDVAAIAALASAVGQACDAGDPAAEDIVVVQARTLASTAAQVAGAVRADVADLPVTLAGGAFDAVPLLYDAVCRGVERSGRCSVSRLSAPPALGAALIALEAMR